jgi:hypothetical protein
LKDFGRVEKASEPFANVEMECQEFSSRECKHRNQKQHEKVEAQPKARIRREICKRGVGVTYNSGLNNS